MKRISNTTSIIASRERDNRVYEVCASAIADFDEAGEQLTITLDSLVRQVVQQGRDVILRPGWLPAAQRIQHHVSMEDAREEAQDVFRAWTRKLAQAIPSEFAV